MIIVIILCLLAALPVSILFHEAFHVVYNKFTGVDSKYLCLNLNPVLNKETHSLMFVSFSSLTSNASNITAEEIAAYFITFCIMLSILLFVVIKFGVFRK